MSDVHKELDALMPVNRHHSASQFELQHKVYTDIIDRLQAENAELRKKLELALYALRDIHQYGDEITCIDISGQALKELDGE